MCSAAMMTTPSTGGGVAGSGTSSSSSSSFFAPGGPMSLWNPAAYLQQQQNSGGFGQTNSATSPLSFYPFPNSVNGSAPPPFPFQPIAPAAPNNLAQMISAAASAGLRLPTSTTDNSGLPFGAVGGYNNYVSNNGVVDHRFNLAAGHQQHLLSQSSNLGGVSLQQQSSNGGLMRHQSAGQSGSSSPSFPAAIPTPSPPAGAAPGDTTSGVGALFWLSSQAGLIRSHADSATVISFQLKDFCDQAVHDLTSVLRPGFTLKFQAMAPAGSHLGDGGATSWIANFVAPVHGADATRLPADLKADLEAPPGRETGPPQLPKDPYSLELEAKAVPMLLDIFEKNQQPQCQLSVIHCHISNCGDEQLYHYVGTSSLKRRQFLERRTHVFHINQSDWVSLQPAEVYSTVATLVDRLLKKGGACLTQELFDHYSSCPDVPLEARELIGEGTFRIAAERGSATSCHMHFADFDLRPNGAGCAADGGAYSQQPPMPPPTPLHPDNRQLLIRTKPPQPLNGWHQVKDNKDAQLPPTPTFGGMGSASGITPPSSAFVGLSLNQPVSNSSSMFSNVPPPAPQWQQPFDGARPPPATFWNAGNVPPQQMTEARVGGRIKRFTDIEVQTEPPQSVYDVGSYFDMNAVAQRRPIMVDACMQTVVEMVSTGCGPQDETVAIKNSSTSTSESEIASDTESNANSDNNSLFGGGNGTMTTEEPPARLTTAARSNTIGFNPLLDSWNGVGDFRMNFNGGGGGTTSMD